MYQKVAYINVDGVDFVDAEQPPGGSIGSVLFITPRKFTYNSTPEGSVYNLTNEGLVAFMAYGILGGATYSDGGYRVVTKSDGTMSLLPFMKAMSSICVYGAQDEVHNNASLVSVAKYRKLEMRCGPTVDFVHHCAWAVGINTRTVRILTAETPNNADDGHILLEAQDSNGKWILFDVPNDCAFTNATGEYLSLAEVIDLGVENCELVELSDSSSGNPAYSSSVWSVRIYWEMFHRAKASASEWKRRIYQIPLIDNTQGIGVAHMPSGTEDRQTWVQSLGFQVTDRATWDATFYS